MIKTHMHVFKFVKREGVWGWGRTKLAESILLLSKVGDRWKAWHRVVCLLHGKSGAEGSGRSPAAAGSAPTQSVGGATSSHGLRPAPTHIPHPSQPHLTPSQLQTFLPHSPLRDAPRKKAPAPAEAFILQSVNFSCTFQSPGTRRSRSRTRRRHRLAPAPYRYILLNV